MRLCFRPRRDDRQGTTTVEMAFVLPVMLILLFGLVEFARAFMTTQMVNAAVRDGAYMGMMGGVSNADVRNRIKDILASGNIEVGDSQIMILDGSPYDNLGENDDPPGHEDLDPVDLLDEEKMYPRALAVIRVEIPFRDVSFFADPLWLGDVTLVGQIAMRHE